MIYHGRSVEARKSDLEARLSILAERYGALSLDAGVRSYHLYSLTAAPILAHVRVSENSGHIQRYLMIMRSHSGIRTGMLSHFLKDVDRQLR